VNGCQQGFLSIASFGLGGRESASKPPQAICKPLAVIKKTEMKHILILFILCNQLVYAQDTLTTDMVEPFSYRFHVENGQLRGKGADSLMSEIQKSHFVLLGETHDDAKIAEFTDVLLSELHNMNYKYFITEHGRYGMDLLLEEVIRDSSIVSGINRINSREYERLNTYPLPFLTGIEDAQFVSTALKYKYQIYGIDQEFFYSFAFLFDKLFNKSNKSEKIKNSYKAALAFLLEQYQNDATEKDYPICKNLLESEEIQLFFDHLKTDSYLQRIVNDIYQSWKIYEMNRTNRQESFAMRGDLMKDRFITFHDSIVTIDTFNAKYIIKLGALHTMRGSTPLGIKDIGDVVHQTAVKNNQKDLNIYFMFRYYLDDEEELGYFDNSEGNSSWLKERKPLMLQGEPDSWTIIDLAKLKNMVKSENIFVYEPINEIMNRHDYLILPPASRDVIENRKTE
jgi:hypothetical protein